ncbi:hypothetical protein [Poseidonibacter sp.]|uniref:hypothetical protein n=1 Tax=Poseidonibacter sp. TaxID=2321188 RepID=UPI003C724D94
MFKEKINNYLTKEICICPIFLEKILIKYSTEKQLIEEYLEYLIDYSFPYNYPVIGSLEWHKNDKDYEKYYTSFWENNDINDEKPYYELFDNFWRIIKHFKSNGIIFAYEKMDSEDLYYPKIILNKYYGNDDDINELDESITIYRGTSRDEYDSGDFSQSWSLSYDIAKKFAFEHYIWCKQGTCRVILKTDITKSDIFYFNKNNTEQEVIVNSNKLDKSNIVIVKGKIL